MERCARFRRAKDSNEQSRAAFDVALGQTALAAISFNNFTDVDLWFLFRHWFLQQKGYLSG